MRANLTKVRLGPFWPTAGCVTMCVSKRICPDEKRVVGRLRVYLTFENLIKFIVQWRPMYIFVYVKNQYIMRLEQAFVTDKGYRFENSQFAGSRMDFEN